MDKAAFDIIMKFYDANDEIELILSEKGLSIDDIEDVLYPTTDICEKFLRIGKYTVEEEYIGRDTYIKEVYEDLRKYTRLTIFYEYENGMALCETTSGDFYLVPKKVLAVDDKSDADKKDSDKEHVVSYWSSDDTEHVLYFSNRTEAELKVKELEGLSVDEISIMTREDYDKIELESIEDNF